MFTLKLKKSKNEEGQQRYEPIKLKVMRIRFTDDEIISALPESERVDKEKVKEFVDDVMSNTKFYGDICEKANYFFEQFYPRPTHEQYKNKDEYVSVYYNYMCTDGYYDFIARLQSEFIIRHGEVRTFEEACKIVADKWAEMIFGVHIQNNGDCSSHGVNLNLLGSVLKNSASKNYSDDIIEKFKELVEEYNLNGCKYTVKESGNSFRCYLRTDYGPNSPLYDILIEAGVDDRDTSVICPWKTGIYVDENDNSVVVCGYQTQKYE